MPLRGRAAIEESVLRIDQRPSAPLLAGVALGMLMVAALLGGLAIGRASTQGLRSAGAVSAGDPGWFCRDWR
jgi:hypothetical protein